MKSSLRILTLSALSTLSLSSVASTEYFFDYTYLSTTYLDDTLIEGTGYVNGYAYQNGMAQYVYDQNPELVSTKTTPRNVSMVSGEGSLIIYEDASTELKLGNLIHQVYRLNDTNHISTNWQQTLTGSINNSVITGTWEGSGNFICPDISPRPSCSTYVNSPLTEGEFSLDFYPYSGAFGFELVSNTLLSEGLLTKTTTIDMTVMHIEINNEIPIPSTAWLFGSALLTLSAKRRKPISITKNPL